MHFESTILLLYFRAALELHTGQDLTLNRGVVYNQRPLSADRPTNRLLSRKAEARRKKLEKEKKYVRERTGW